MAANLELASGAWLCVLLVLLGIRVSFYRLEGAYKPPKGEEKPDLDSYAHRFQRAHGNLAEWVGAYCFLCLVCSPVVLGSSGFLADWSGIIAATGAACMTTHRLGMIVYGLKVAHPIKIVSFGGYYACTFLLGVRALMGTL